MKDELNCILLLGPRASGKTSTVCDLIYDIDDTLLF
jgi:predicted AAA+ superfamily ATPase